VSSSNGRLASDDLPIAAKIAAIWSHAKAEGLLDEYKPFAAAVAYRFSEGVDPPHDFITSCELEPVYAAIHAQQVIVTAVRIHQAYLVHEEHERQNPGPKPQAAPEAKTDWRPTPKPEPSPGF
jgi:hypothetical protein